MTDSNKSSRGALGLSEQEKQGFLIKSAQEKLLNFCQIIDPMYEAEWFHEVIGDVLEDALLAVSQKRKKRIILTIPPRHGKSQTASIYFPAWALGRNPNIKFILSTYGADLSEKIGMKTRDVIQSEIYKSIFPQVKLRQDTKAKAYWLTKQNGSFLSVGVGGAVTGTGADIILIDDPVKNREDAESSTYREKVWEYYRSTLYSRLEGSGVVIVIMQRWHTDDLVGRLLEEQEKQREAGELTEDWEIINFPAIAEEDETYFGRITRKVGDVLWPNKFPLQVLENIRNVQGTYNWSAQYMQDPILAEHQEFKIEMFKKFKDEDIAGKYMKYYTFVDPAISQKDSADNTVVLTVAKELNGPNFYRVREDAGHYTPKQTIDLVFKHNAEYRSEVYIESIAYQKALKLAIEEEQKVREQYFKTHETKRGNKEERVRGLLPMYERGVIWHKHTDVEYERELLAFPRGKRDDRCDAMSFLTDAVFNSPGGKRVKQFYPHLSRLKRV